MICRILHDEMTQTILRFIINNATPTIVSSRNSVRVVPLIARGWRGTSLPRGNICKEIETLGYQKRNTYGVEKCVLIYYLWPNSLEYQ